MPGESAMDIRTEILTSEAIAERASAIGVSLSQLADEAGVAASTPYRWNSGGATVRTLRAVQRVLEARERTLLLSLLRLHPDLASQHGAAA